MPRTIAGRVVYSTAEAAELLGVDVKTIQRYVKAGRLQGQKFAGAWHFTQENMRRFLDGGQSPGWYIEGQRLPEEQQKAIATAAAEMLFGHGKR